MIENKIPNPAMAIGSKIDLFRQSVVNTPCP
jgi:hypothetical protein